MTRTIHVAGIAGSLRHQSYSRAVLHGMADCLPPETVFTELLPGEIPHYNFDAEGDETPAPVHAIRQTVAASDAVLIVTPEFNHGLPGVLKNVLDWLSRPAFTSCMVGKPVAFATISPGALGGVRAQYQLRETLSSMLCKLVPLPEIAVTHVAGKLADNRLADEATLAFIGPILRTFLEQSGLAGEFRK